MTLKVNKILHVEKSLYQDVLVFESEAYGNVLVLDGVIQCTERDEFSYQEMIAHLPLTTHPNPKKVLVIGGGDGGVVREVLRHDSVEEVVLCDIDEAVIRVSKTYLPHMSALLQSPKVTVFVGDGFKFLSDNEATYDVIITDSSDPVGPAEALFQKPYFQLLHDALAPGGHISTQGECLWLHLPLISQLRNMTSEIFPVSEYAYTTIPTYPSGQIGFMLASKDATRNFREPIRKVPGTLYYNEDVHRSAFILPEFARSILDTGKDIRPIFGRAAAMLKVRENGKKTRKVLLLGAGLVSRPCAEYILRDPTNELTIACRTLSRAKVVAAGLPNTTTISLDARSQEALDELIAAHDIVIALVPHPYLSAVIKAAIKGKTHVVNTSYLFPDMKELHEEAKKAGIVVLCEIGLDPGLDHLYAVKTISEVHAKGGKIKKFLSYCGGLPAPECAGNPLGYKFSFAPQLALSGPLTSACYLSEGREVHIPGSDLMKQAKPYYISPAFAFYAYPNRDSLSFKEFYNIPEAETIIRGTLRYQVFPDFIRALVDLGLLDSTERGYLTEDITSLVARIKSICKFRDETESSRIISGLRWIGLFSSEKANPQGKNVLDTLGNQLEKLMKYEPGERDFIMLQHKFFVEWQDGTEQILTSTFERYGSPGGHSAMAVTVGVPAAIGGQLILNGAITTPGVIAPYTEDICVPLRAAVESEGMGFVERVL
ncbi:Saccharopine dehydrogenase-domain-containing protein [Scleroderma citrinum]